MLAPPFLSLESPEESLSHLVESKIRLVEDDDMATKARFHHAAADLRSWRTTLTQASADDEGSELPAWEGPGSPRLRRPEVNAHLRLHAQGPGDVGSLCGKVADRYYSTVHTT